jgi:ABC-type nickel/cobalt efflux system permease component RcnA
MYVSRMCALYPLGPCVADCSQDRGGDCSRAAGFVVVVPWSICVSVSTLSGFVVVVPSSICVSVSTYDCLDECRYVLRIVACRLLSQTLKWLFLSLFLYHVPDCALAYAHKQTDIQNHKDTRTHKYLHSKIQTHAQQTDKQADRQTDRHTDRQIDTRTWT